MRLAQTMGIAYYDNEIITGIAQKSGLAEEYVNSIVEKRPFNYPITIGQSFSSAISRQLPLNTKIYIEQHNTIGELAEKSDCLIMGRCSDYILRKYHPLKVFVYADMHSRLLRCRQRASESEHLSDPETKRNIRDIDKGRAKYYNVFTGQKWGAKENYSLCINMSNVEIKDISLPVSELLKTMFHN